MVTITGQVLTKMTRLTQEQQQDVLKFIEKLESQVQKAQMDAYGSCSDLRSDLSFEEFQNNRREMWGGATDREF